MLSESDVRNWWDTLIPEERGKKASDLYLLENGEEWSSSWDRLAASQQLKLVTVLQKMLTQ